MRRLTISLDVDDVVLVCTAHVVQIANEQYGRNINVNNPVINGRACGNACLTICVQ